MWMNPWTELLKDKKLGRKATKTLKTGQQFIEKIVIPLLLLYFSLILPHTNHYHYHYHKQLIPVKLYALWGFKCLSHTLEIYIVFYSF